jgi:hypothetical protein
VPDFEGEEFSVDTSDAFEEVDYGREFQDYLDPGYKTQEIEFKDDAPSFDQFLSRSATLTSILNGSLISSKSAKRWKMRQFVLSAI